MKERCIICNGRNKELDQTEKYILLKCMHCGFVYKPDIKINYKEFEEGSFTVYNFDRSKEVKEIIKIIKKYFDYLNQVNLVEIGSGTGILLNYFRDYGINVRGYEPSSIACEIAKREFNILLENKYFDGEKLYSKTQVILLYDVVEHLDNLNELLFLIKKIMDNNTIVLIKSGNPNSLNARLSLKRWSYIKNDQHIAFYTKKSLRILCDDVGLDLVKYHVFKHAYGGIVAKKILKNIIKAVLQQIDKHGKFFNKSNFQLAQDHFIAVIKKNNKN